MKSLKIGIFGSAFNPPTKGHLNAFMQFENELDEIWLTPSIAHAFNKKTLPFTERCQMLKLFLSNIKSDKIKISEIEKEFLDVKKTEYVYTYELLCYLKEKHPDFDFVFICGEDNANKNNWSKFKDNEKIDLEFGKLVAKENTSIRSTQIRNIIKDGDVSLINDFTFENVKDYIVKQSFYK